MTQVTPREDRDMEAFNQAVQQFFFQRKLDLKPNVSLRPFMPYINLSVDG
jgi:hypothetical protein